jgi:hypothetical protein
MRTRDPHLGKVFEFVHVILASPLRWVAPVYESSTESARVRPRCRAVSYGVRPFLGRPVAGRRSSCRPSTCASRELVIVTCLVSRHTSSSASASRGISRARLSAVAKRLPHDVSEGLVFAHA